MNKWNMNKMFKYCSENRLDLPIKGQKYINTKTKYKYFCTIHEKYYLQEWNSHRLGMSGCTLCHNNRVSTSKTKYSMDMIMKECLLKKWDIPQKGQKYITTKTKYIFICPTHGEYRQTWEKHKDGQGCPKCKYIKASNKKTKTHKYYYQECIDKGVDLPIEDYKGDSTKINHKCGICGNVYEQTPSNHLRGQGCPYCYGTPKKTNEQYIKECEQLYYDLPIEPYVNNLTKIKHRCNKCGFVYKQTPSNHLQGQGCPKCGESHGERFIRNYLDTKHIKYIPQKKFNDLKDKRLLSYDFYLPEQKVLIEYQGEQHYEQGTGYMDRQGRLEKQQYHDKLKKEYAKKHGYRLLEIHYSLNTQEKVNKYLERVLKD